MMFGRNYFERMNPMNFSTANIVAIIFGIIISIGVLVAVVFYLLTLYRNLKLISLNNRKMDPGLVWLNLIPLFGLGWMFYTVFKIKESNELEFKERNIPGDGNFGYNIGLAYCILSACGIIPCVNYLTCIPALVCWIIYWVKVAGMNKSLETGSGAI